MFNRIVALQDRWGKKESPPAPAAPATKPTPVPPAGPRDPAAGLDDRQRERFDALVARGAGEEEAAVLAGDDALAALYEAVVAAFDRPAEAAALLVHDLRRALADRPVEASKAAPEALADVLRRVEGGTLTRNAASAAVAALVNEGGTAEEVVQSHGLAAVRDADALAPALDAALDANPEEVARYRAGEQRLFGFFVGQAMRRAGKGADPTQVQALLRERLDG